ncbi:MAG: M48 family metalloprotease [Betaproteobacteria bacterium]|nr:M48 family metalloprotease [Betaproteobacteria bacterium]
MLYALSVAAIVACVNAVVWFIAFAFEYRSSREVFLITSLVTLAVIALGTVEIVAKLSLGRGELAALLAGRPVARGSVHDDERRLVNIVDELSIASGLAAPPLYVLHRERGINAFAAGASPSQAVVVVTRGALEQLSRDELQAVIAHEFSHILHGDIRLNLRAVYVLQGIVFLSSIGRFMMRYYSGVGTEEGRRFVHLPLAILGVGVFAIGSVGLVCCRIIQASIARERENLADASAVQFTRNADALCGALARIRVNADGSRVLNWHADALAHMLFSPASAGWLRSLIATHPSLEERMRRINPHVAPEFYFEKARVPRRQERQKSPEESKEAEKEKPRTIVPKRLTGVAALIAAIGSPDAGHLEYASGLLAYLSPSIREALADAPGAQAVMFASLLHEPLTAREQQLQALRAQAGEALARRAEVLAPLLRQLDRAYRLPLVALAVPVLKSMDEAARAAFLAALRAMIQADRRVSLSEFVLETILDWSLGPRSRRAGAVRYRALAEVAEEAGLALSLLAHAGESDAQPARASFLEGTAPLALPALAFAEREALMLARVSEALERLSLLAPLEKERLLDAAGKVISARGVKLMEHELLRAIACVLDCPMPPGIAMLDPRLLRK